jgi:hypothetical protein
MHDEELQNFCLFVLDLLNDTLNLQGYAVSIIRRLMHSELDRKWKEAEAESWPSWLSSKIRSVSAWTN